MNSRPGEAAAEFPTVKEAVEESGSGWQSDGWRSRASPPVRTGRNPGVRGAAQSSEKSPRQQLSLPRRHASTAHTRAHIPLVTSSKTFFQDLIMEDKGNVKGKSRASLGKFSCVDPKQDTVGRWP